MKTIETTLHVEPDGRATLQLPREINPGEHRAVLVIEEAEPPEPQRPPLDFPVYDSGPWPEGMSLRREGMYDDWGR